MYRGILFILIGFGVSGIFAQEASIRNFTATPYDDYVELGWTTDSGYTCTTLIIEHSVDSIHFSNIYVFPGVCGSFTEAQSYQYIHSAPQPNRINYYRLLPTSLSQQLNTQVYFKESETFLFYPNPASRITTLYLTNEPVEFDLVVSDLMGNVKIKMNGLNSHIDLDVSSWSAGKYNFTLSLHTKPNKFKGSLLVIK